MITKRLDLIGAAGLLIALFCMSAFGQSTEFSYQGKLNDASVPANGTYDFEFRLFAAETGGSPLGTVLRPGVAVADGIVAVWLDFGAQFGGPARWLEIAARQTGGGDFTTLGPRQPVTSTPYAIRSSNAASADALSAACTLCLTDGHIQSVHAGKITGVLAVANGGTGSSTKNFVDLSTDQTGIGGNKTFTGKVIVTGANGVFSGNGAELTNLNGASIAAGSVTTQQIAPEAAPNSSAYKLLGSLRWDLLRPQATFAAGVQPRGLCFDGTHMWVAISSGSTVVKIRVSDGESVGTFTAGTNPYSVAFDGANIWVVNLGSNNVTKLRASDGANLGAFPVGSSPYDAAFDGVNIWVANFSGNNVTKLRASDGANLGTFPVGSLPGALAFDGTNIWVVNAGSNSVTRLRGSDGANLGSFAVGGFPQKIAFDGANMWVTNSSTNNVTKLRASDGSNLGNFAVGAEPRGVAFDGANIWVASHGNSNITKLRASDGANLGTFFAGINPQGAAFDGANIWIANLSTNSVTRLPPAFPGP